MKYFYVCVQFSGRACIGSTRPCVALIFFILHNFELLQLVFSITISLIFRLYSFYKNIRYTRVNAKILYSQILTAIQDDR